MSPDQIHASLRDHPEQWSAVNPQWVTHGLSNGDFKDYTLCHESGVEVWISNGLFFLERYDRGNKQKFTLVQKLRIWRQIRRNKEKFLTMEKIQQKQKISKMNKQFTLEAQQQVGSYLSR